MALAVVEQKNICANPARGMIFIEGDDLCFNYKTGQWTELPAYDGLKYHGVNSTTGVVGLTRFSSGAVCLQTQTTSHVAQTATLETGSYDLNQGGRVVLSGARPLINGGSTTVSFGVQDALNDSVSWSTAVSVHSRTKMANWRSEGRYVRCKFTIAGGFTTAQGADVDFAPAGRV
jgi:hypothetical protein